MRFIFVTNQFKTGGVETVFYNIASTTCRPLDLLPVHQNYDDLLIQRLPENVNLIQSGMNPERTYLGFISSMKNAYKIKKALKGEEYIAINFGDTLSSLITAYILSGRETISWLHTSPFYLLRSKAYKFYISILKKCSMIVFICNDQKNLFFKTIGKTKVKSYLCYNYVNLEEIEEKSKIPFDYKEKYFFMAARLDEKSKDYKTLIEAYSLLPEDIKKEYKLVLAGDGPDEESIKTQINDHSLRDHVQLLGNVSNPYVWMKHSSLYIHASLVEGFPMSLLEALTCGCNIVSADCQTGPSEILEKGQYGELYTVGDANQLKEKIMTALHKNFDPQDSHRRADEITQIGRRQIEDFFNGFE